MFIENDYSLRGSMYAYDRITLDTFGYGRCANDHSGLSTAFG